MTATDSAVPPQDSGLAPDALEALARILAQGYRESLAARRTTGNRDQRRGDGPPTASRG